MDTFEDYLQMHAIQSNPVELKKLDWYEDPLYKDWISM